MTTVLNEIVQDLAYLCHLYSYFTGIRICNDSKVFQCLRKFLVIFYSSYFSYSIISGEVKRIRYHIFDNMPILKMLDLHTWCFLNAISIYLIPKYLNQFLSQYKAFQELSSLDLCYFRNEMSTAKKRIHWTLISCHSIVCIVNTKNLIRLIGRHNTNWNKFRAFVTYIPTFETYVVLSVIEGIMMYFGCYYRYLYKTIIKSLRNLDNKSDKEIMPMIYNIRIIYQQMTEHIVISSLFISPLVFILMAYIAPDLIIHVSTKDSEFSKDTMKSLIIIMLNVYLILALLKISWISAHYAAPYEAIYRLSFDCPPQRLKLVSIL